MYAIIHVFGFIYKKYYQFENNYTQNIYFIVTPQIVHSPSIVLPDYI